MLENLSNNLTAILNKLRENKKINESDIEKTCLAIREELIDADVALVVIDDFISKVKSIAKVNRVASAQNPVDDLTSIIKTELFTLMGVEQNNLPEPTVGPVVINMYGLQGSGKTITAVKVAKYIKHELKKRVLLATTDIYRPEAIAEMKQYCVDNRLDFHEPDEDDAKDVLKRALTAVDTAAHTLSNYVIIDTAGRQTLDKPMISEIKEITKKTRPTESLIVVEATLGQDAIAIAKSFNKHVEITGVCLTKVDGDARRPGAILSTKAVFGAPIKFIGTGRTVEDFKSFDPQRMADKILGLGDL